MATEREHFKLGLTVIVMLALAVAFTVFIGKGALTGGAELVVHFPADSPLPLLKPGSAVRYGGRDVGRITSVGIVEGDTAANLAPVTAVRLQVEKSLDVRRDCKVVAVGPLLGGPGTLEVRTRGASAEKATSSTPLTGDIGGLTAQFSKLAGEMDAGVPGSLLARIKTQFDETRADSLISALRQTVFDLALAMRNVREQTDPQQRDALMARLQVTVEHVTAIAANIREQTETTNDASLAARLASGIDELNLALSEVTGILQENRPDVRATMGHVRQSSETLALRVLEPIAGELNREDGMSLLAEVHQLAGRLNAAMADVEVLADAMRERVVLNRPNIDTTLNNLRIMSDHLAQTGKDLKRNPWRLLYRPSPQAEKESFIFDASREFAEASGRINDALTRVEGLVEAGATAVMPDDPVMQALRQELQKAYDQLGATRSALWERLSKE